MDISEIISFGSVCAESSGIQAFSKVLQNTSLAFEIWIGEFGQIFFEALVAIMCLIFALFLIPYELHVAS